MSEKQSPDLDAKAFRQALGTFMTGVTIVTTLDQDGNKRGFTANSFTSVSLEPPLVLVCIASNADAIDAFTQCAGFGINILNEEQQATSTTFATKEPDKFDFVDTRVEATGAPLIDGCLGWFDCVTFNTVEAGDHIILIGEVKSFGMDNGNPLGYWRGGYVTLGIAASASEVDQSQTTYVSSILTWESGVLMQHTDKGWCVPATPVDASQMGHDERIAWLVSALELDAETDFLYSVFETASSGENHIVYRGSLMSKPRQSDLDNHRLVLFDEDNMPWNDLINDETESMLRRYFKEAVVDSFGIYTDGQGGSVMDVTGKPKHWKNNLNSI